MIDTHHCGWCLPLLLDSESLTIWCRGLNDPGAGLAEIHDRIEHLNRESNDGHRKMAWVTRKDLLVHSIAVSCCCTTLSSIDCDALLGIKSLT
jgi:hypothetical protein